MTCRSERTRSLLPTLGCACAAVALAVPLMALQGAPPLAAAKPERELQAGTLRYRTSLAVGTRRMSVDMVQTIEAGPSGWIITESVTTPAGPGVDRGVFDKATLALQSRSVQQGPVSVEYRVEAGRLVGELRQRGQVVPITLDLASPLVGDGPGAANVIATLPLDVGYRATLQTFTLQSLGLTTATIAVTGSERVTVPAGSFDAFTVSVESDLATGTLWISKETRRAVKSVLTAPAGAAGSAPQVSTTELLR